MRLLVTFLVFFTALTAQAKAPVVASKIFTESYLLGELAAQSLEEGKESVNRKLGMGSTGILFESLKRGAIDVYPDYTGTLSEAILKNPDLKSADEIRKALLPLGLTISDSLGFNNTYALAVKKDFAAAHALKRISDLKTLAPTLKAAFSYEFMDRKDGYSGMRDRYRLNFTASNVKRLEHSLAYQAIAESAVQLIEVYSTDAKIKKLGLQVLEDDLHYFPSYEAVWVARTRFTLEHPGDWQKLLGWQNKLSEALMIQLNARADIEKISFSEIISEYLGKGAAPARSQASPLWHRTVEHLFLVGLALLFSIFAGIPLGFLAAARPKMGQAILLLSALVQTIPSLALLCFLIPLFGVGTLPALVALCLYSLLPVVLNTYTGIRGVDPKHLENAQALGLSRSQIIFKIIFPLASPTLLAGIKTATIVSIGTATLAALVGAGGYGVDIVSGLALNDIPTILRGAIPAAAMALGAHALFEWFNRFLRVSRASLPAGDSE